MKMYVWHKSAGFMHTGVIVVAASIDEARLIAFEALRKKGAAQADARETIEEEPTVHDLPIAHVIDC